MVDFKPIMHELLKSKMLARIATASRDAVPHAVAIWFIFHEGAIYFATDENSKKLRNLKENPKIAFVVDDEIWDRPHSLMIFGRTEVLFPGTAEFDRIFELLCVRYPPERDYESPRSRIVRIVPERIAYWKKE